MQVEDPGPRASCGVGRLFWGFLGIHGKLFTHGSQDDDIWPLLAGCMGPDIVTHTGILLFDFEQFLNLLTNLTLRHLDVILGSAIFGHKVQEAVLTDIELWIGQGCAHIWFWADYAPTGIPCG